MFYLYSVIISGQLASPYKQHLKLKFVNLVGYGLQEIDGYEYNKTIILHVMLQATRSMLI